MRSSNKEYFRILTADNGDVTIALNEGHVTPENLLRAALDVMRDRPDLYLGTWLDHPQNKNFLQAAFASEGRTALQFHPKTNIARYACLKNYVVLDREALVSVLHDLTNITKAIRQLNAELDQPTLH